MQQQQFFRTVTMSMLGSECVPIPSPKGDNSALQKNKLEDGIHFLLVKTNDFKWHKENINKNNHKTKI